MRIVGELSHPIYKITVLVMNEKYAVKIERDLMEQTFKFRDGTGISSLEDIRGFLSDDFMTEVEKCFILMARARSQRITEIGSGPGEFDKII